MKLEDLKKTLVLLLENDLSNLILAETYVSELSEYDCRLYSFLKSLFRLHQASIFMTTYISSFRSVIKSNVESFLSKYLENNVPLLLPDNFEILLKSDSKSEKDELSTSFLGFSSVAFHSLIVDIKGLIGKAELRIEHDRCFIMQKCASENCDFGLGNFFQDCLVDMNSTILNLVMFLLKIRPLNFGCQSIYEARDLLQTCYSATDDAESLSKRTFYDIRSFLLNESKAFFSAIHEKSINKLNDCLQSEKWIEVRSPARYQKLIDKRFLLIHLQHEVPENGCQSSESTTTETSITYEKLSAVRSLWWDSDLSGSKPDDTYESVSDCDHLIINDEKFKVVDSILRLLDVISSYVEAAVLLSPVTSEVIHKLVQILSIFGSRTCQLILGAGAMHSAGLKSITARHLAIASQCLSLIMSVVPIISSELSSRLPAKHHLLLKEFDRVTRDCENYRSEIFSKLIKIMEELIQGYFVKLVKDLQSYFRVPNNGQSAPPQASASVQAKVFQNNEVHPSIKNSTRQLRQLHKILTSMMTPSQRQEILYRVAECFGSTLNRYLGHLSIEKHSEEKKIKEFISEQVNFILRLLESLKIENPKAFKGLRKWSLKSIPHGVDVILEQND